MRRPQLLLLLTLAAAAAAPPAALAVARVITPAEGEVGERIHATGAGLKPGRYSITLVADDAPARGARCLAYVGKSRKASSGRVRLSGKIPAQLRCVQGAGAFLGKVPTMPGRYHLVVGVRTAPAAWSTRSSFARRPFKVVE